MSPKAVFHRVATPRQQQGVVLFIALIALVAMSLIGISMIRQGSSAQMIVGNLAFREQASYGADLGVEQARAWLVAAPITTLNAGSTTDAYVANGLSPFDPFAGVTGWLALPLDGAGNQVRYIIHRLCRKSGPVVSATGDNLCVFNSAAADKGSTDYKRISTDSFQPYYRITVRVEGARNTVSYSQVLVY